MRRFHRAINQVSSSNGAGGDSVNDNNDNDDNDDDDGHCLVFPTDLIKISEI